jgi:glutathione S-transferase
MDAELAQRAWFAGDHPSLADVQMSFAVEAALSRATGSRHYPHLQAWLDRVQARPAYRRAVDKGGPVVIAA